MHRSSKPLLPLLPAAAVCLLLLAPTGTADGQGGPSRPFWMDPPQCESGEQFGQNHVYEFTDGFWGPQKDPLNRHGALRCRSLEGDARRFHNAEDNLGEMGPNTAGSFYMGEDHLVAGEISFEMRVQTDHSIPDHPAGVKQKDYLFQPGGTCDECTQQGVWMGGANQGGSHYFKIGNGLGSKNDRLLVDFDAIEYGSIRVVVLNRVEGTVLSPEPVYRYPVPDLQPDQWVHFDIKWMMGSSDATRGWNQLELTVNGTSHSFQLLDFSCPIGRMFQLGNVDRRYWNEAHTGVMEERTCGGHDRAAGVSPECRPSEEAAPFPHIQFRNMQLYLPEDTIFMQEG